MLKQSIEEMTTDPWENLVTQLASSLIKINSMAEPTKSIEITKLIEELTDLKELFKIE